MVSPHLLCGRGHHVHSIIGPLIHSAEVTAIYWVPGTVLSWGERGDEDQ